MADRENEKSNETKEMYYEKPKMEKKGDLKDVMAGNGPSIPAPSIDPS